MAKSKRLSSEDQQELDAYISNSSSKKLKVEKEYDNQILNYKIDLKFKNEHQKEFATLIKEKDVVICKGMSGCGKSFIALAQALKLLQSADSKINKIYLLMPSVESGKNSLGLLPGTWLEKIAPYLDTFYYLIDKLVGKDKRKFLVDRKFIEPLALQYLRGKNIDNAILIFDEAQNCDIIETKTVLTRIGENTKIIFAGDVDQIDNKHIRKPSDSGLYQAYNRLGDIDKIGLFEFDENDIVRNPLISTILSRFPKPMTIEEEEAKDAERFIAKKNKELELQSKPKPEANVGEIQYIEPKEVDGKGFLWFKGNNGKKKLILG